MKDGRKTISDLEGRDWGPPPEDAPPSVRKCFELRRKPVQDLTVNDLRLLIGQDIGLTYLVPKAIEILEVDPLVQGEHFHGDLLASVLRADHEYFRANLNVKRRVETVLRRVPAAMERLDVIDYDCTAEVLSEATAKFEAVG